MIAKLELDIWMETERKGKKCQREACTSSEESVMKDDKESVGLVACVTTVIWELLYMYATKTLMYLRRYTAF